MEQASRGYKHIAQTKPRSARAVEAYHPSRPTGKLLPNQNDLISKPRSSHSSLVVTQLS
jgi:hypothetical protein